MNRALKIIVDNIVTLPSGQPSNMEEIFSELRAILPLEKFSDDNILTLIDDAIEIRCKLALTVEMLIRSAYAKSAVHEGISKDQSLEMCSSLHLKLPKFIVNGKRVADETLNKIFTELGCGVVWKDRIKFIIVQDRYFGSRRKAEFNDFRNFSHREACYAWLVSKIADFFDEYTRHIVYEMAQNFYVNNIDPEKIQRIFALSAEELAEFIIPQNYEQM
ncbi:MAG: hypothetical protein E7015_03415 [Alphaproteobacteria bacterium]|nr:hypothetical protein [Alphaproteobacteria bacterium]